MTADRSISDVQLLTEKLAAAQDLEAAHAGRLAQKISQADNDIWAAALQWAATGQMPAEPVIEGQNPALLSARLNPSQVFTALMGLRSDPERALSALRHFPRDLPHVRKGAN
ncbi:MAG TPA: hypothetical protein VN961_02605 [Streptosporangiaceae bacterium]|nr:hypothetical protein [Streptosporangiaceae bacterium]